MSNGQKRVPKIIILIHKFSQSFRYIFDREKFDTRIKWAVPLFPMYGFKSKYDRDERYPLNLLINKELTDFNMISPLSRLSELENRRLVILSFNCNGISDSSHARKDILRSIITDNEPDVVFLQELGREGSQFLEDIEYVIVYAREDSARLK